MHKSNQIELLNAIVNSSDDAIMSKTLDGTILSWNPGAEKIFGYKAEEMIGEKMLKIFPSDRLHEEEIILSKIANGEQVDHFRTKRCHKDGHLIESFAREVIDF